MIRIGDSGETCTPLTPGGFVTVAGDRLPARCESGYLENKQAIVVISGDNLGLIVRGAQTSTSPHDIPGHGEVVFASFGAKVKSEGQKRAREQLHELRIAVSQSIRIGGALGLMVGLTIVARIWFSDQALVDREKLPGFAGVLLILGSLTWGVAVGRVLFGMFERMGDTKLSIMALCSIFATLVAAGFTFDFVFRNHGMIVGLFSALSTTVVSGSSLLAFALLGEWMGGANDAANESGGDSLSEGRE